MTDYLRAWLIDTVDEGMRRKNWTQARLAAEAGITQKHISQLLNGKVNGSVGVWSRLLVATGMMGRLR